MVPQSQESNLQLYTQYMETVKVSLDRQVPNFETLVFVFYESNLYSGGGLPQFQLISPVDKRVSVFDGKLDL